MPVQSPPLRRIDLGDALPVEVAARLRHLPGLVFFDSALRCPGADQVSIVAACPGRIVDGEWARDRVALQQLLEQRVICTADHGLPHGFAAGWTGYDGKFHYGLYDEALFYRHSDSTWWSLGDLTKDLAPAGGGSPPRRGPLFRPELRREDYLAMVERAQEYIASGDIYQVNLAHPFSADWEGDPWMLYESLRHYSPAPFSAYLHLGGKQVLSSSPELFLRMSGDTIRTRPIKGTRPRRSDAHADEKSAYDLLTSPKEVAELIMITDLERNDLGQICEWGSVTVTELLAMERYAQVFHLVSTVEGRLRPGVDHLTAMAACFPGGSITGAPKRRARQIISELEPYPRGIYTGAIGWFGYNGESQFNIAIRTVVCDGRRAHFHVGAGIVADSIPEMEWQETLDKAAGILLAAERM